MAWGWEWAWGAALLLLPKRPLHLQAAPTKNSGLTSTPDQAAESPNNIYDVRHARVLMIVDYQQLPKLFDAINSVNFMTVLDCKIQDVDEYQAMLEGYVYGSGDAVRVDMLVESIWLREWTVPWMPSSVKQELGIADATGTTDSMDSADSMNGNGNF